MAVDGGGGDGGSGGNGGNGIVLAAVNNNKVTMALAARVSLTDGGGGNGSRCHRLCSSG